ncbi:TetR/AcrR family transcriptional regulator [Prescottella sp. R16]|uniref:TetR/AcrR family transcriptional regulator n=1 Tax=Prescottella TaxID=2979332 RepID=UPI00272EC627|nr:TetR/AcrR family transcriptional regulator [Prescottella sp. R16]
MTDISNTEITGAPRRTRDRKATEQRLLDAARRLLARDGVLSGLNLREVADEAGVNRGQVYQYFGTRRELLRAAIAQHSWEEAPVFQADRALPFTERRERVLEETIHAQEALKLTTLLVLDGDPDVRLFPHLERSRTDLQRDRDSGQLHPELDPVAAHAMTAAMNYGYTIFREQMSREIGVSAEQLDEQVAAVAARMLAGLAGPSTRNAP